MLFITCLGCGFPRAIGTVPDPCLCLPLKPDSEEREPTPRAADRPSEPIAAPSAQDGEA